MLHAIHVACDAAGWTTHPDRVCVPLPAGRHQVLKVQSFFEDGHAFVRIHTAIAPADVLNVQRLSAALRLNAGMRFGAFAVLDDELVLCDTLLSERATPDEVHRTMEYLARRADDYEKSLTHADAH